MLIRKNAKLVVCGMSGGVDSAVAALLLKKQGFNVLGVFMRNWDIRDETGTCAADADKEDAYYACQKIGIGFKEANFVKEYWNEVFSAELVKGYQNGLIPNPDIICNKKIKFKVFHDYCVNRLGANCIATGHYAQVKGSRIDGFRLLKGADRLKDQSLFLSQISQESLGRSLFPVGNLLKSNVKKIAVEAGLDRIAKRKESTGICFIGKRNFQDFISDYVNPIEGNFINFETGQIIGKHKGIHLWALGQCSRLHNIGPPLFICKKDAQTQDIYVVPGTRHPALFSSSLHIENPHWIHSQPDQLANSDHFYCDFRFQHVVDQLMPCKLSRVRNDEWTVHLKEPLRALSPGQFAVFYLGNECLGSARITSPGPSLYELEHNKQQCTGV